MENKVIHMTYKKPVPYKVYDRWKRLNPDFDIQLSLDHHCIDFLLQRYHYGLSHLFKSIPQGMYKADLWRLCKLYSDGGVYADVDLVPYLSIPTLEKHTFYSCLAQDPRSIFQAFMVSLSPKNPLMLCFLISFLMNRPYHRPNGPCYDMANVLLYNIGVSRLEPERVYTLDEVKVRIPLPPTSSPSRWINLGFFPSDIQYTLRYPFDKLDVKIENHTLIAVLKELQEWNQVYYIDIVFPSRQTIFLFKEIVPRSGMKNAFVVHKGIKILDSRDPDYFNHKGW